MSATHERMLTKYVRHPSSASTDYWGDGVPLDPHIAMMLASNAAHLSIESLRHLVLDPLSTHYEGKNTWEDLQGAPGPPESSLAGASGSYSWVSWAPPFTRRYGPFFVVADRETATGVLAMRRIRGQVKWAGTGGGTGPTVTALHCALTTQPDPRAIVQGDLEAYTLFTQPTAGSFTSIVDLDWSPSVSDSRGESIVCREGGSGQIGATTIVVTQFWIWLCVLAEAGADITSATFWEDI